MDLLNGGRFNSRLIQEQRTAPERELTDAASSIGTICAYISVGRYCPTSTEEESLFVGTCLYGVRRYSTDSVL